MKVAIVYHFFPHYRGGVIEEINHEFADVRFYGQDVDEVDGIPSYRFSQNEKFIPTKIYRLGKYIYQAGLTKLCLLRGVDCVVFLASPNFVSTWIFASLARLTGKRVIFWGHGYFSSKRTPRNIARAAFFRIAHSFYTYGYRAKVYAQAFGFSAESIYVGFNSLAYRNQIDIRKKLNSSPSVVARSASTWKIVCVSRLTAKCRYDLLVEAISLANRASKILVHVDFIGDGPERVGLERLCVEKGVSATFYGAIYDEEEVAYRVWDADVAVSPGKVGLTAMHCLMYGVPIITHDDFEYQMPEVEAIVQGVTGLLFRRGDCADLSRAILHSMDLFHKKSAVRERCFRVVDEIYNPKNQVRILRDAIYGVNAEEGDSMNLLFLRDL